MPILTKEDISQKMDELTPSYLQNKGGVFSPFTITLDDGTVYSQAVARILHANEEHYSRNATLDIEIKNITYATQIINGKEVPMAVIHVRATSSLFGVRENIMTAILDTDASSDKISATHPLEKAITQAIGRTLALYGFAFTGVLASEEEIYEGKSRQAMLEKTKNNGLLSPIELLKKVLSSKNISYEDFLNEKSIPESVLMSNRNLVLSLIKEAQNIEKK